MTPARDLRDASGRCLYEERRRLLPGLGQPDAPDWEDLDEAVRERWRGHADATPSPAATGRASDGRTVAPVWTRARTTALAGPR